MLVASSWGDGEMLVKGYEVSVIQAKSWMSKGQHDNTHILHCKKKKKKESKKKLLMNEISNLGRLEL